MIWLRRGCSSFRRRLSSIRLIVISLSLRISFCPSKSKKHNTTSATTRQISKKCSQKWNPRSRDAALRIEEFVIENRQLQERLDILQKQVAEGAGKGRDGIATGTKGTMYQV